MIFVNIFLFLVLLIFLFKYIIETKKRKNLEIMIDFFGVGFSYKQITKEEFMKISSFCEDVLVKKYYFIKETIREGANNEYDIISYCKIFKEYNKNIIEKIRIQLIPDSLGRSINVICNGSDKVVNYFIMFYNYTFNIFKKTKIKTEPEKNIIKIVKVPSFITELEIDLEYNRLHNGYVKTFRTNAKIEQKENPDPIAKKIETFVEEKEKIITEKSKKRNTKVKLSSKIINEKKETVKNNNEIHNTEIENFEKPRREVFYPND